MGFPQTTIVIESALLPTFSVDVTPTGEPPSGFVRFLRPRVTTFIGSTKLHVAQPAKAPTDGPPWGLLFFLAFVAMFASVFIMRRG